MAKIVEEKYDTHLQTNNPFMARSMDIFLEKHIYRLYVDFHITL